MCQYCIGVGKLVIHKIYGTRSKVQKMTISTLIDIMFRANNILEEEVALSSVSKEAARYILEGDARRYWVQYEEIKSGRGLKGMDSYMIRVLRFLEFSSLPMLGITGMHGVGKTTLLWLVQALLRDHSSFDYIFYLDIGRECTVSSLQHSILATILGPRHKITDVPTAAKMISSSLKDKSFLFLLDDLQGSIDLNAIGLPMPLGRRQGVIFTTPDQTVCDEIGCVGNTINMHCLGEEDAWSLFTYNVDDEIVEEHPAFKQLGKQIVQECRGLPVALTTLGRAMSLRKEIREWRHVLDLIKVKHQLYKEIKDLPYPSSIKYLCRLLRL